MRINQNVAAFNAYRNLSATGGSLSKSLEKLSSGFRINRAADDAAGLVKSESLRAEIGGTRQAIQNAQDGVSFVQTAEGALNEVHAILQRMRDLAVSASNTATSDGVAQQSEITELRSELAAIGQRTTFAGASVFQDYSVASSAPASSASTTTAGVAAVDEVQNIATAATAGTFTLTFEGQTTAAIAFNATTADVQSALEALSNVAPGEATVTGAAGNWNVAFSGTLGGSNRAEMTADSTLLTGGIAAITTTTEGIAPVNEVQNVTAAAGGGTFTLTYAGQTTAAIAYNASTADVQSALEALSNVGSGDITVGGAAGNWNLTFGGALAGTDVTQVTVDDTNLTDAPATSLTFHIGAGSGTNHQLSFSSNIAINTASSVPLFGVTLNDINVDTSAETAISLIDTAIAKVGQVRSTLGATQNRLEHTITNLNVASENLAASESRIRDADMALEMVSFTRHQIMSQAGVAMLAQANTVPQSVLRLLQ